jgi:hypothetical protein
MVAIPVKISTFYHLFILVHVLRLSLLQRFFNAFPSLLPGEMSFGNKSKIE